MVRQDLLVCIHRKLQYKLYSAEKAMMAASGQTRHVTIFYFKSQHKNRVKSNNFNLISIIPKLHSLFTALHLSKRNIKNRKQISCVQNNREIKELKNENEN